MDKENTPQEGDKLFAGKYKTVEELEKAYNHANDLISKGQHKEPAPEAKPAAIDSKAIEKAVAEALKQQSVKQHADNAAAIKKMLSSEPDAALSLKKALYTSDGKQEKEYLDKIEKGEVSPAEVQVLIERGKELEEPPSFLDKVLKERESASDFEKIETEYYDLLDDPALYNSDHDDYKKKREKMFKLQDKLGLPREDFANMEEWSTGTRGEETIVEPDGY